MTTQARSWAQPLTVLNAQTYHELKALPLDKHTLKFIFFGSLKIDLQMPIFENEETFQEQNTITIT